MRKIDLLLILALAGCRSANSPSSIEAHPPISHLQSTTRHHPLPRFGRRSESYLGFIGYGIQIGSDDRHATLCPDDPDRAEQELRLDFHPLSIDGDLEDCIWICGVDANGHGTIRAFRIEPDSPSWLVTLWAFTSPEPSYFTGVVHDRGAPGGQLFLLDGLGGKLYSLPPDEPELTLVASGEDHPELRGMQLLMLAGSESELWLTLADVKHRGEIAPDTVLTLLIDRDGDHRLDEIRQELASDD